MKYDRDKINEAWRLVMGGQFHDILPGTSIPRAYEFAWNDELLAANQFANVLADSVGATARALDTLVQGVPLVVFNPLSFEREDAVEAAVTFAGAAPKSIRVYDRAGRETPSQLIRIEGAKASIVFLAKVPSVGYAVFDVRPADAPCALATGLKAAPSVLENGRYIVKLNAAGDIAGIRDKAAGKELLAAPVRLAFQYERPQDWPAWNQDWADRQKPPAGYVGGPAKITVVENGPARVAVAVEREARHSKFVQIIRLAAGGERVEFDTHIDWATAESSLKATFPLAVSNPKATYTFGVGTVQRGNNDPLKFEVPSHRWFDLTHTDGSYGVSVLDDCKYGSDKPADNVVRLTLLYTPGVRGSYREQRVQDFGQHDMLYALCGHRGDWRAGDSPLQAARLNQPLLAFQASPHAGTMGRAMSFLSLDNHDVILSALKKAEDGDELIVRLVESKGKAAKGIRMAFPVPIASAREMDGQERELGPASVVGGKLVFDITPYHLRTFALKLNAVPAAMAPPVCAPVALPYNADVISWDAHKADGDFNGRGQSYPAEMLPDTITSEAIAFRLGPKADGADNAVACAGQTIALPVGNFNKLYILAAADEPAESRGTGGSNKAVFKIGPTTFEVPVQVWSGFLGQWDRRMWWEGGRPSLTAADLDAAEFAGLAPAYLRLDNVAFFTTHRHLRSGENEAYAYAYIYKYRIDLPAGAKEIVLPVNGRVKILAMTAAWNENDAVSAARPLFDTLERDRADYARFRAIIRPQIWPETSFIEAGKPVLVTMLVRDADAEIHYTLDGSLPSLESPRYEAPIRLDRSAVVKAVAFDKVRLPSAPAVAYFSRSLPVKNVQYLVPPLTGRSGRAGRAGNTMLIDLVRAGDPADPGWQMFDKNLDVVLDLGEIRTLAEVVLGVLENHAGRVFGPAAVEISVSADNKNFKTVDVRSLSVPEEARPAGTQELRFDLDGAEGRYVHVLAKTIGSIPKWHPRAGLNALMGFDEIVIR